MASNDLMMRIQLLVESGRSSGELRRLQKDIEGLTKSIKSLENTRITPLVRDINAIKLATAGLKGVNLSNFASELNSVKTAFAGLGVSTKALDDLRTKYNALNAAVGAGTLKTFQNDLAKVKDELLKSNSAIVPLQNNIRKLRAEKGVYRSLGADVLSKDLRLARAELSLMIDKYKEAARTQKKTGITDDELKKKREAISAANRKILEDNVKLAKQYVKENILFDKKIAQKNKELALQRNTSALRSDEIKQLNAKIAAQKATEQSLAKEIKQLTSVANAQANARKLQLQSDLSGARGQRTGLQSRVRELEAEARAEIQRIRAVEQGTKAAARQSKQLTTLGQLFRGNVGIIKEFGSALRFALGPQMAGFAAAGSILQLFSGFFAANKEIENLNRGLNAITSSGTLYFEELRRIANTTGQSIQTITSSFLQLVAASKGTRLEGEATRKIFEAVSRALVITGADTVRSQRAFLALAQIMSKGQVYAEELRQQLSEALPGAVQVFARSLEISPQKMLELMKEGKVSSDSLLLFAMQLEKEYAILGEEMFTFSQKAAVLQNELQRLFLEIGKTGVWQAFGDALIFVRDLVRDIADGVGTFGYTVSREFNAISAAFQTIDTPGLTKGFDELKNALTGAYVGYIKDFLDLLKSIPDAFNQVDFVLSQLGNRFDIKINTKNTGIFEWINDLDTKLGTTSDGIKDLINNFNDLISAPIAQSQQSQETEVLTSRINKLREELDMLYGVQSRQNTIRWIVDDKSYETVANRIAQINKELPLLAIEQERAAKKSVDAINAQNDALRQELELRQKQIKAQKEIQQNEKFISGFSPRARSALSGAYDILKNYQRTSETLLRLEKESEQAMVNKANAAKRNLDLINEIYDAEQRGRQAQEGYDKDKANDENDKLKFKLSLINQIREAEENAKKLRQGREEAGIYFTEDQKQASENEAQAYKLRVQATEELAKAAKETNNELKKGYLENAKFLLEEANQLYVSAGNTYLLKKNSEELLTINDQLSKTTQNQITKDRERENGLRLLAQAQKLASEAFKPEIAAPVRDTLLNQADELAKKAQAIFADINFSKGLEDTKGLRTNIANTLENAAGELQNKIDAAIKKFNAANQGNLEQVATALADASTLAVSLQNELINKILGATTEAGRNQLLAELTRVQNEFRALEKEYDQVNKRLEDAGKKPIKVPFIIDPTYMTFGESMSNQIDGVKEDVSTLDSEIGKDVPKKVVLNIDEALKQHEALTAILSTPITRQVIYKAIGDIPAGGTNTQVTGSTGGYLPGYGGGDRIRALLEPGEFVFRKEAVRSIGLDQLTALNRQRVPRLSDSITVPRMAAGGAVIGAPIVINVPGQKPIRLSGSRDQAVALANLLTSVGRAA